MTNRKLAYIEQIAQVLNEKIKKAHSYTGLARREFESIETHLEVLSCAYNEWMAGDDLDDE